MIDIYYNILTRIKQINFNSLWQNFTLCPIILYNNDEAFLNGERIARLETFHGNTAIKYNDEYVAIWDVENSSIDDYDIFTSKIIHEMFHAFQMRNEETRFANEIIGMAYNYDPLNITIKSKENILLISLYQSYDEEKYNQFLQYRLLREKMFPEEFNYEMHIEVIEGMAEFVELKSLKFLNENKYEITLKNLLETINDSQKIIKIREMAYHSSSILLTILDKNNHSFDHIVGKEKRTIFSMLNHPKKHDNISIIIDEEIEKAIANFISERKLLISNLIKKEPIKEGIFPICAFDPMNSFIIDDLMHVNNFIGFLEDGIPVYLNGEMVLEINKSFQILKIYK
ncbi:MAG: hypothetical protein PHO86_03330 [Bacilli bacterium]|nr:hypothetical protein [Bacilli bacterium]